MLVKVEGRRAGTDVRAVVFAGDGVHGILAEEAFFGGQLDGVAGGVGKGELVETDGTVHEEKDAAGVLANGLGLGLGEGDVLLDDLHRAFSDGPFLFAFEGVENRPVDVVGDFG